MRRFDEKLVSMVGRLPGVFHGPFHLLGLLTNPAVWLVLIVLLIYLQILELAALWIVAVVPVASVLKLFIRRNRPQTLYARSMRVRSYSFPSSHAYAAALVGGYLVLSIAGLNNPLVYVLVGAFVAMIGVSRVFVGAHYPSDVVAGWLIGGAVLVIARANGI